ncbi:ParB/RepB/Spo0J family partition protein [Frigoriglobus tundricola]|uniref:ParB-like N-terminal domain-containing protein n=1 Tax=Frigoriglobus tundricola TaxID=2774151 RepID=A0A6M5YGH8_9BACT|nr:ParB N-terminal domain-containing protein [Frigoriglobus tundricola]QJW93127.1 hypothetical protein FTUN_0630 [Frigoriglobus tundricola]
MAVERKRTTAKWKLAKLKDHPRQAEMFGDVGDEELEALAENMKKRGLRDPIEIMPDGTVIAGHQRVRAAKLLGWAEIDVVVLHDLAALGPAAVEERFVEDNFLRRQLGPLAKAKCIRRLMELEEGKAIGSFGFTKKEELKSRIAKRMGLSLRSVNRYLLLLETPVAIQEAFDKGEIPLVTAGKVALLTKLAQADFARRIAAGEKLVDVLAEHAKGGSAESDVGKSFGRLLATLRREIPLVRGQRDRIHAGRVQKAEASIREAIVVLNEFAPVRARS